MRDLLKQQVKLLEATKTVLEALSFSSAVAPAELLELVCSLRAGTGELKTAAVVRSTPTNS